MARPLRIQAPGLTYHVNSRGNRRADIFLDDRDRRRFINRLALVLDLLHAECHAYCLMTNHYHLVVTTRDANLSRLMQGLNSAYGQWWNHQHNQVGHLFQSRFHAQVIQNERYLLTACAYVVLNPVRAGLVDSPERWKWSSYRATAGLAEMPPFLRPGLLWQYIGGGDPVAIVRRYREFVADMRAASEGIPAAPVLGDAEFVQRFKEHREQASREVPGRERRVRSSLEALFTAAATRVARIAQVRSAYSLGYTKADIARFLELNPSTITKMMKDQATNVGSDLEKSEESRPDPIDRGGGGPGRDLLGDVAPLEVRIVEL
jgi:putative transposase